MNVSLKVYLGIVCSRLLNVNVIFDLYFSKLGVSYMTLMTRYLLKKIINAYKNRLDYSRSEQEIDNINSVDFDRIISVLHPDSSQQSVCIHQLETLATMYQIYDKQNQDEKLKEVEQKIIHLLGYRIKE